MTHGTPVAIRFPFAMVSQESVAGSVLVAPGGAHLELCSQGLRVETRIAARESCDKYAPSVDRLFSSAAKSYGRDLVAVVLTGMGDDGCLGVCDVKQAGGSVLAESEETAVIFGMPQQAIRSGAVDRVLPLREIAASLHGGADTEATGEGPARRS